MAARDLRSFEWGAIIGAHLAGAWVKKFAEIANVSRGTVLKVMTAWEKRRKDVIEG